MKTIKSIVYTSLYFLLLSSTAFAVPYLQLDASNSTYNDDTESIVSNSDIFTLYALVNDSTLNLNTDTKTFYISIALPTNVENNNNDFGSFSVGSKTYYYSDLKYGTPSKLPKHDIFPTYYVERSFTFSNLTGSNESKDRATSYNSEDTPGGLTTTTNVNGSLAYAAFDIDISNLNPKYQLHFDLYTYSSNGKITKAPFSHDAETGIRTNPPPDNPVPEPSTIMLLGFGLLGLSMIGRKKIV
ncbi:MAG: choice-of-anchor N protein [Desulfamplus sp.]|nr:choice-of-anchor N protein [Desulfamplus sp.]